MNWETYLVDEWELDSLIRHNHVIEVHGSSLTPNAGVEIYTSAGKRYNAIYDAELRGIRKLNTDNPQFRDMQNRDLALYNDLLSNPKVNTIIVDGFFGTGKTSIVSSHLVHGLLKELRNEEGISMAYISKPHVGIGQGYGYLPGDLHAKTLEEFKSFTQYFDRFANPGFADMLMMVSVEEESRFNKQRASEFEEQKGMTAPMLEILPFEYLRGRDIPEGWVILDEAQNTNEAEMASFLSRIGDGAKAIIIGDSTSTQIDRRGNTSVKNGLAFAKEVYADKKYAGYVELQSVGHILRGERVRDLLRHMKKAAIV